MKRLLIISIAILSILGVLAPRGEASDLAEHGAWLEANPGIAQAMSTEGQAALVDRATVAKAAAAYDHSHSHTDCAYWAQLYLWYMSGGTATLNEWPWYLDGWRTPFMFYGDQHTQCSLKNVYYGYPVWTWALMNIDHSPVDEQTHDWEIVPVGF